MPKYKTTNSSGLTPKEELFCEIYISCLNGTEAYSQVYNAKTRGVCRTEASKLLAKPHIQAHVAKLKEKRAKELGITKDFLVEKALKVYYRSMSIEKVLQWDPKEKKVLPTGEYKFDSKGANDALDIIAKVTGLNSVTTNLKAETKLEITKSKADELAEKLFGEPDAEDDSK